MNGLQQRVALDRLNTFGLPATAARYLRITSLAQLVEAARAGQLRGPRPTRAATPSP